MTDTCYLLRADTSICFSVVNFKVHVTDMYSKVLIFIDPHISWLGGYFKAENLKRLKQIRPVYETLLQYGNFTWIIWLVLIMISACFSEDCKEQRLILC